MAHPLTANDVAGAYPNSWYAATATALPECPSLKGHERADVAIIGAGYTGLNAAIACAERGLSVTLVDAHRIGWGASGRNGGQVGSDFNKSQSWLEARVGTDNARLLWSIATEAADQVASFCETTAPDAMFKRGIAEGEFTASGLAEAAREIEHLDCHYPDHQMTLLDPQQYRDLVASPLYHGGTLNMRSGHVHPLRYCLALAKEAQRIGVRIFERTRVTRIDPGKQVTLHTGDGSLNADHLILAGNGYIKGLDIRLDTHVMPVNSFIGATPPLGEQARDILTRDIAACDASHVVNYYRLTHDNRLLFGGRANYSIRFPKNMETALATRMRSMFPQLGETGFDYVWGGTLGITMSRLPFVTRLFDNVVSASGYSGHGVALASLTGRVLGEAVAGQASRFETLQLLPTPPLPTGPYLQSATLPLAMLWYRLRDKLGI